jgi:arylsulfatase
VAVGASLSSRSGTGLASFKEFPPRQKPASFSLDEVMQKIQEGATGYK